MSLESSLTRIAALQAWTAPPVVPAVAPAVPQSSRPDAAGGQSFQATLAQAIGSASPASTAGAYRHLTGDLDANPDLLARLEGLAAARGETWTVTSGLRTTAEQQELWDGRASNPFPVAPPGTSLHEHGNAADVTIDGRPIQDVIPRDELIRAGLNPLAGDAVHVELAA